MFSHEHSNVKPICDKVVRLNLRQEFRMLADAREKYRRDMASIKDYAWDEGHAQGHAQAKAEADEIIRGKDAALSEKDARIAELEVRLASHK